jgi:peptidoglycan-associated lipoprotein
MRRIKVMQLTCKPFVFAAILAGVLTFSGCHKKAAQATPPPPPAPPAPSATLAANPAVIEQGQATTLTWQTDNATDININGIGAVMASGSRTVTPGSSTTYTLTAKGPGGSKDASTRVTVNARVAQAPAPSISDEDLFARNVKDLLFDYDKSNIRADQAPKAQTDAAFLLQHPSIKILVEGHCDDRGSEEYNLALGTSRAESLKRALLQQGISADRIRTVSYGKERPFCTEDNDACWQRNRVDHFTFAR